MEQAIADPENASDYEKITQLCSDLETQKQQLNDLSDEWILLSEEAEMA